MICNDEDTDGRARVTTDEERVLVIKFEPQTAMITLRTC